MPVLSLILFVAGAVGGGRRHDQRPYKARGVVLWAPATSSLADVKLNEGLPTVELGLFQPLLGRNLLLPRGGPRAGQNGFEELILMNVLRLDLCSIQNKWLCWHKV